jgi:hypothetical protein
MKISQQIIAMLLIAALLMTCFPINIVEDISRDGNVDLQDVILVVKGVARTVETNQSLKVPVGKAMSVINVAAGLKKVIRTANDKSNALSYYDNLFLVSATNVGLPMNKFSYLNKASFDFHSVFILPELPPPRHLV